jgi:UDP-N-acetylglucosamine 2-epimerase (non-hydrolysing)
VENSHNQTNPRNPLNTNRCTLILTDLGGIQEEAPSLGKPVLVMREVTERPEGIEAGMTKLVGIRRQTIINETAVLLTDYDIYKKVFGARNPYGDGKVSEKIIKTIMKLFALHY